MLVSPYTASTFTQDSQTALNPKPALTVSFATSCLWCCACCAADRSASGISTACLILGLIPGVAGPRCSLHIRRGRPRNFRLSHRQGRRLALASLHIRMLAFATAFGCLLLRKVITCSGSMGPRCYTSLSSSASRSTPCFWRRGTCRCQEGEGGVLDLRIPTVHTRKKTKCSPALSAGEWEHLIGAGTPPQNFSFRKK